MMFSVFSAEAAGAAIAIAIDDRTKTERNIDSPLVVLPGIHPDVNATITAKIESCAASLSASRLLAGLLSCYP